MTHRQPFPDPARALQVLRALLGLAPGGDLSQGRFQAYQHVLDLPRVSGGSTMATISSQQPEKQRSLAIGKLRDAAIKKIQLKDSGSKQRVEAAEKALYEACLDCYRKKLTKEEVRATIKAIHSEFS